MKITRYILMRILIGCIQVYKRTLSPFLPPTCRYYPSCSDYAAQSIEKYGLREGVYRAVKRVLRCHPGHEGGYDPVD